MQVMLSMSSPNSLAVKKCQCLELGGVIGVAVVETVHHTTLKLSLGTLKLKNYGSVLRFVGESLVSVVGTLTSWR
jgi:hypothetical protein